MSDLIDKMEAALSEALADLDAAADEKSIEEIKIRMLGRKGFLPAAMKEIKNVSNEEKPLIGKVANKVKTELNNKISEKLDALEDSGSAVDGIDVTIPGRQRKIGKKHLITRVIDDCVTIFRRMGFVVVDGPELEDEYHNFDALNTPADHPSRDSQDTFYLLDGRLLRTQTSPVQIRTMEKQDPPVRIVCPGRCFRRDTPDATHSMNFSQIEGLHIDTNISMADLKGTLLMFAQEMFGEDVEIRMRPHFFPFTEPSIECDVLFRNFKGGKDSWLEIFGAGMVDPNVLTNVGYDPEKVTGYAFGLGIERIAMLKYDIPDIRYLYENDIRFLEQF